MLHLRQYAGWLLLLPAPCAAWAEVLDLRNGGRIAGEIVNRQSPRKNYVVRLATGDLITLDRGQVERVVRQRPAEVDYGKMKAHYADTADGQWRLAQWCRENNLPNLRQRHLERVIELDGDHLQAREALGYIRPDGIWKLRAEVMAERGYVRRGGRWLLPQEIELIEHDRRLELARKEWLVKLRRWRSWLAGESGGEQSQRAADEFRRLADPAAVPALETLLSSDRVVDYRRIYLDALVRIGGDDARNALLNQSLADQDASLRRVCLDAVLDERHSSTTRFYIAKLASRDNAHVNRAAVALAELSDTAAVGPLIGALVTKHYVPDDDDTSQELVDSFAGLSNGFAATGNRLEDPSDDDAPILVRKELQNPEVRRALVALSGGEADFQYDRRAWKAWWKARRRPPIAARR